MQLGNPASPAGTQLGLNGGARVIWLVNRHVQLALAYDVTRWNESNAETAPQTSPRLRNLALASIRLTP